MIIKPRKFLFYIEREFHFSLFKSIIHLLLDTYDCEIALYSPLYRESNFRHPNVGARKEVVSKELLKKIIWINNINDFQPDVTIIADSSYESVQGKGFIVNIGHGTISKGSFYTDTHLSYRENCADLMAVPGQIHKNILSKYLYKPIEVIGMPKLDEVFKQNFNQKDVLISFGLCPENKTVLIAPTFNPEFSLIPYLQDRIFEFISSEYNVILKLHGVAYEYWQVEYKKLSKSLKNFYYYEDYDLSKAFTASDVIISDVSSVVFEFMATGKPGLVFNSPLMHTHKKYNPNDIEHKYRNIAYEFSQLSETNTLLKTALSDETKTALSTQISRRFVSITDGSSTRLLIDNILKYYKPKKNNIYIKQDDINIPEIINNPGEASVFISSDFDTSPNTNDYLINCLMLHTEIQIAVPLYFNSPDLNLNIGNYFPETKSLDFETIKIPISYRNAGKFLEQNTVSLDYFACKNHLIAEYLNCSNMKFCLDDFKKFILNESCKKALIFDAVIRYKKASQM